MVEFLIGMTAITILSAMATGYRRSRDAFHPVMLICPMMLYFFAFNPAVMLYSGQLQQTFATSIIEQGLLVHLVCVLGICLGLNAYESPPGWNTNLAFKRMGEIDEGRRSKLFMMGFAMGLMAFLAFAYLVYRGGGPLKVFSRPKPFLIASSGYLGELPLLGIPAVFLIALARQQRHLRGLDAAAVILSALPQIVMGSLGGRRGPAFIAISSLLMSWFLIKGKRPTVLQVIIGVLCAGSLMLFLLSNRQNLYIGSNWNIDFDAFVSTIRGSEDISSGKAGNDFTIAIGSIATASNSGKYHWGLRYFTIIFVRPIPRQIWPTKYQDMGYGWMARSPGSMGYTANDWRSAVGFVPQLGTACGFAADMFVEFWWFAPLACYGIGRLIAAAWYRWVMNGGFWTIAYFALLALSVFLVAQSVQAWLYRSMIFVIPVYILWRFVLGSKLSIIKNALVRVQQGAGR